jgi:V/A-type H+-transporting ATPase subunit I
MTLKMSEIMVTAPKDKWGPLVRTLSETGVFHPSARKGEGSDLAVELSNRVRSMIGEVESITSRYRISREGLIDIHKGDRPKVAKVTIPAKDWSDLLSNLETEVRALVEDFKGEERLIEEFFRLPKASDIVLKMGDYVSSHDQKFGDLKSFKRFRVELRLLSDSELEHAEKLFSANNIVFESEPIVPGVSIVLVATDAAMVGKLEFLLKKLHVVPMKVPYGLYRLLVLQEALHNIDASFSILRAAVPVDDRIVVEGFVPESSLQEVKSALVNRVAGCEISEMVEEEEAPVTTKGMEPLIKMYGKWPRYGTVDPTPIMTISFPAFFGLMFADIGQGFLVLLAGIMILRYGAAKYRNWAQILAMCGGAAMVFGLLSGEFFGIPLENYIESFMPLISVYEHHALSEAKISQLLGLALLIGIAHLAIAYIIALFNAVRERRRAEILELAAMLTMYISGVFAVGSFIASYIFPPVIGSYATMIALLSMVLAMIGTVIATREPAGVVHVFVSIIELASNTISYTRLVILFMVHTFLMGAVNNALVLGIGGFPILLIGNIGIMGLEGILAFVQSLRLHFYEFFSKFYKEESEHYAPVRLESKYGTIALGSASPYEKGGR